MATRLSRHKIAAHVADRLLSGSSAQKVLKEVAAYLVDSRRTRETELVVREIEEALASRGVVVADVTSAHPISKSVKAEIARLVGAKTLQIRETIDPGVLGGVHISLPGKRYDGTLRRKIMALKAKQL